MSVPKDFSYYPGKDLFLDDEPVSSLEKDIIPKIIEIRALRAKLTPKVQAMLEDKEQTEILLQIFRLGMEYGVAGGITMDDNEQQLTRMVGEAWKKLK